MRCQESNTDLRIVFKLSYSLEFLRDITMFLPVSLEGEVGLNEIGIKNYFFDLIYCMGVIPV